MIVVKDCIKRFIAAVLCMSMFVMNVPLVLYASDISGVTPNGNTYNIEAEKTSGETGFRHYEKFDLTSGDIANLIYKDTYSKFVNLVDSQISIDGIVNTMKNGNFYNGHAIFVSPNGIVVGANGVLNVGSLSMLTPSQDKFNDFVSAYGAGSLSPYQVGKDSYNGLITDSHGNIVINGKILSHGDVDLYGDTITIKGENGNTAGVIAGWNDSITKFSDLQSAKNTFNSLVSNNINDTTNFALVDGKIKIVAGYKEVKDDKPDGIAKKAEVTIEDAKIGGSKVEIKANSTREFNTIDLFDSNNDSSLYDFANTGDAISSKITIKNSDIAGRDVDISATSQAALSRNLNLSVPTVLFWIFNSGADKIDDFFKDGTYEGFEGVRTSAVIDIINSKIQATKDDLSITTSSISNTGINSDKVGEIFPHIFYGYGTKTESKINIKDSTLKAQDDVKLNALSQNVMEAAVSNNGLVSIQATNAYDFAFVKNSTIADTKITVDNSTVEGKNVSAQAFAYNNLKNKVALSAIVGKNDFANNGGNGQSSQGGSAAAASILLNATDIKSSIEVKNNSVITASKDVSLNAFNINEVNNSVTSSIKDPTGYTKESETESHWYDTLKKIGGVATEWTNFSIKDIAGKFKSKINQSKQIWNKDNQPLDEKASFEIGAGALYNNAVTTNNIIINNSTITAGNNIDIKAHTVDLTANSVASFAKEDAKVGGAFSVLLNNETNNNTVDIIDSTIKTTLSKSKINIDSIVELPAQQGTFGVSMKLPEGIASSMDKYGAKVGNFLGIKSYESGWKGDLTFGFNFNFGADDNWSIDLHSVDEEATGSGIVPAVGLFGLFNSFAVASGAGDKTGLSGAVVVNDITNNSDVNITNSTIEAKSSGADGIYINSVVSESIHDALDFISSVGVADVLSLIDWSNAGGTAAIGGSVLVQNFTNNARTTVTNSTIDAKDGNLELNSAAEQSYLNLLTPGGKAETVGVVGAISVQNIKGTTGTTVKDNSTLNAGNVSVNSGKAKVAFSKKNTKTAKDGIHLLNDKGNFDLGEAREVKDHVTTIALDGTFVLQSKKEENSSSSSTSSSGAAVGASVIVKSIARTVKTSVENSTLTAKKINVMSGSYDRDILVTAAAAFAGGVSTDKDKQKQANQNAGSGTQDDQPQEMQNIGDWMSILFDSSVEPGDVNDLSYLLNNNNSNQQAASDLNASEVMELGDLFDGTEGQGSANPQNATSNFSLALAGAVSVLLDMSVVQTEIKNATLKPVEELNVSSSRDNFLLNVTGGVADAGNVGGGAAVNVYADKGSAKTLVDTSTVQFASDSGNVQRKFDASSTSAHEIIETAVGIGIAKDDQNGVKAAVGGSFNTNNLKDTTEVKVTSTTVSKEVGSSKDADVNVKADAKTTIWNAGGDAGYTGGNDSSFAVGAGVAGNMDLIKQTVNSEIKGSTFNAVKDVVNSAKATYYINSIGVAGAIATGAKSSFTIDGALGLDFIKNNITATVANSTISASGDVKNKAKSTIEGRTLTGAVDVSTADSSLGVGIGAVIETDNSKVIAQVSDTTIQKSRSVEVSADSSDKRQFLAVNCGVQTGSSSLGISANGIIGVIKTTVNALVSGTSEITSDGDVKISSVYDNTNEGITAVVTSAGKLAAGANIITNYYENDTKSELSSSSKISKANNVEVSAKTNEKIDLIPVAAAIAVTSSGAGAVAADVVVNIIKDKTNAIAAGNLTALGNLKVAADGETTMNNRGGTLALTGLDSAAALGGAVNVDHIAKTVNAQIGNKNSKKVVNAGGNVSVTALSTNSLGGTPVKSGDDGEYKRKEITSDSYQDNLIKKDNSGNYGLKYDNDFKNWNMFYNLSAGGKASVAGTVVVKTIENTVNSEIINAEVNNPNTVKVIASDYSIKNIIAGQVSASKNAAIGVQVLVTNDQSKTTALVTSSEIKAKSGVTVLARNQKDNNQIVVAASGSINASIGANILVNTINDVVMAKIYESEVSSSVLTVNAEEDINATRIVVSASGAGQGVAMNVNPIINYYGDSSTKKSGETEEAYEQRRKGKTVAEISKSTIKNAKVDVQADTNIKTWDLAVGVVGAGEGLAASGLAIKNTYNTKTKALIDDSSSIDTEKDISLAANSIANAHNLIVGVSGVGIGVSAIANVIINNMVSEVTAKIADSGIVKAGNISLNTNKDKKDKLKNYGFSASGAGEGAAAVANVMYNIYDNKVASEIINTSVGDSSSISVNAFSDRDILNYNVGVAGAGLGAALIANAIVNNIRTQTLATVNSKAKNIKTSGALSVIAEDVTQSDFTIGFGAGGFGAAGANINLFYSDNLAKAEVASTTGQIEANKADVKSTTTSGMKGETVGVVAGIVGIAGDVQVIRLGKALAYDDNDTASGIDKANSNTKNTYDNIMGSDAKYYNPTDSSKAETGSVARVNGNLKTSNNIDVKAENKLNGKKDGDALELTNVAVAASGGNANVGIKNVKIANNTIAEISGGTVESENGKVLVDAKNAANVNISTVKVDVAGLKVSGGSEVYNNTSNTVAQIVNSTVKGNGVDVVSNSSSRGKIKANHYIVTAADIGVDLSETKDKNNTSALISGNTNIDTKAGKLMVHATSDTDLSSEKTTVKVSAVTLAAVAKNTVDASSVTQALIKNVTGKINATGIDVVSDYNKMSAYASSNITSVSAVSAASWTKGGAVMNATFSSGINSPAGLEIVNKGQTLIETAKGLKNEKISAKSVINKTSVELGNLFAGTFAEAKNTATSNTYLNVKDHSAKSLEIDAALYSVADAYLDNNDGSLLKVSSLEVSALNKSKLNLDIAGKNTIEDSAVINAINEADANSDLSAIGVNIFTSGLRLRINSEMTADTVANIGGNFSFKSANITVNTKRNSVMSKGKSAGGVISVADAQASNILKGESKLNIKDLNNDSSKDNELTIKNNSTNKFDVTSAGGNGGLIDISEDYTTATLNSSAVTNVIDSQINSNKKLSIETKNNTTVKDSATARSGGFITVTGNTFSKNYTVNAKLSLQNSNINARDVDANVLTDLRSAKNDYLEYGAKAGGVFAGTDFTVTNTLNQTAALELKNTKILSLDDVNLNTQTSSLYKQRIESGANGLGSFPSAVSNLTSYNTQIISLDSSSMISAKNDIKFNLDSSNTLDGHVKSIAKNFAGTPTGESCVTAVINNTLDNSGTIKAGNLVDIKFMKRSHNNLTVDVNVQNDAAFASTSKDGGVTRTINNTLNVNNGAQIVSDKNVGIQYSDGYGDINSRLYSKATSYILFGIPIVEEETISRTTRDGSDVFNLNGKVIAGTNSEKYMKINSDGSVDMSVTTGFTHDDYDLKLYGDDWNKVKQEKIDKIENKITSLNKSMASYEEMKAPLDKSINEYNSQINDCNSKINACNSKINEFDKAIDDINKKIESSSDSNNSSYVILNSLPGDSGFSDFDNAVFADLKQKACVTSENQAGAGASGNQVSEAAYDAMFNGYKTYYLEYFKDNPNSKNPLSDSLSAYLANYTAADEANNITAAQKTVLTNVASGIEGNLKVSNQGIFTYQKIDSDGTAVTLVGLYNPVTNAATGKITSCDNMVNNRNNLTGLNTLLADLKARQDAVQKQYDEIGSTITSLQSQILSLNNEKQNVANLADPNADAKLYSIEFKDVTYPKSKIEITGLYNTQIKGSGTFEMGNNLFKVDNYSTRSLIFNNIDTTAVSEIGLFIHGTDYSSYKDQSSAINDNVHFVTTSSSGESGIIVNNYYDNTNPLAEILEVPESLSVSDIVFNGIVKTGSGLKVFNDSGSISFEKLDATQIKSAIDLVATKGDVNVKASDNTKLVLSAADSIFAGNSVNITAGEYDIKGKITAGYNNDLNLTITNDMLSNLKFDPTTGENILIDIGQTPWLNQTNNIKAVYKNDSQGNPRIYLFKINDPTLINDSSLQNDNLLIKINPSNRGKININSSSSSSNINMSNVKGYEGEQKVTVKNNTSAALGVYGVYAAGNIDINSTGNIYQLDTVKSSDGSAKLKSDGNIYSYAPICSARDIIIQNDSNNTGTYLNNHLGTSKGDIKIINKKGAIWLTSDASLVNLSSSDGNKKYGIYISNSDGNAGIDLFGKIYNEGGGDIVIENNGKDGIGLYSTIENKTGDIKIENSNSNIMFGYDSRVEGPYLKTGEGNIVITQTGGDIVNQSSNTASRMKIESGGNLTLDVTDGNIGAVGNAVNMSVRGSVEKILANDVYVDMTVLGSVNDIRADNVFANMSVSGSVEKMWADKITADMTVLGSVDDIRAKNAYLNMSVLGTVGNLLVDNAYVNLTGLGIIDKLHSNNANVNMSGLGIVNELRADKAYINCSEIRLAINDGVIRNYAEFRNKDKVGVVNNENTKRIDNADIQLYTAKKGSFNLTLDDTINIKTNAPVVYNNPNLLVNGYQSEGNFVNKGMKESKVLSEVVKSLEASNNNGIVIEAKKFGAVRFDAEKNKALTADYKIYELSTVGATVKNDKNLKRGDITTIMFDISDVTVKAKVVDVDGDKASLEFIDMTEEDEQKIHSMFNSLIQ